MDTTPRLEKQFDIEIIKSFRDQKISIGEFIAYTLPISSFEQIEMNFGILMDKSLGNLMSEIKEYTESLDGLVRLESDEEVKESSLIITEPNLVKASIGRLFYHRHIIAHEASFNQISVSELQDFFKNVSLFINFLEEIIQQTLYPNVPRSSFGLSVYAMQEAAKKLTASEDSYKKITRLVKKLYSKDTYLLGKMLKLLKKSKKAFKEYYDAEIEIDVTILGVISRNTIREYNSITTEALFTSRLNRLDEVIENVSQYSRTQ